MQELITRWTTAGSSGGLTIMYVADGFDMAVARSTLATLWGAIDGSLTTSTRWTIDTNGRDLSPLTGQLQGFWAEPTVHTAVGALSGSAVANASQILLRWRTADIEAGRLVQGRSYVPGMGAGLLSDGQIATASAAGFSAAAQAFASADVGFVVWHRPVNGGGGSNHTIVQGSAWNELSVLRRRRD